MIKMIIAGVISAVLAIGIYEKYILGLDRSERNTETSEVLDVVTEKASVLNEVLPKLNNKEDLKEILNNAEKETIKFIENFQQEAKAFSESSERRPYR